MDIYIEMSGNAWLESENWFDQEPEESVVLESEKTAAETSNIIERVISKVTYITYMDRTSYFHHYIFT